ncbi:hypothetical protein PIB30_051984 [Stylosanthes scabra]|uniref:Putative plant transposon protein domain-containing protein n=1 Tax=Stylosanthes scabra TaxID=79078 RepID=A0ABU6RIQ9_9FABA|nr:hypothetical protein [Stylosanthes scabra]
MRFKAETVGAETDYKTRQATYQRLDEVLADLCIPRASWRLSSGQPAVPIELRRTELHPLAKGWQDFIIHSLVPMGNKSEITIARAILIYSIMRGEEKSATTTKGDDDEDEPMPQVGGGNEEEGEQQQHHNFQQPPQQPFPDFQPHYESQYHEDLQGIEEHLSSMQFLQQSFYENMQISQANYMEEV